MFRRLAASIGLLLFLLTAAAADWTVAKSSGEVWVGSSAPKPVTLKVGDALRGGETIRTGRTGRVLMTRGEQTLLVSPNSEIALPKAGGEVGRTTILQRAG